MKPDSAIKYKHIILFTLLGLAAADAMSYMANAGFNEGYFTTISISLKYVLLLFLIFLSFKKNIQVDYPGLLTVFFFTIILWNVVSVVRGIALAKDYWDWKFLLNNSLLFMFIPLTLFIGKNLYYSRQTFKFFLKYLFMFGFILIPLALASTRQMYSRVMAPCSILLLFIPFVKLKWKVLISLVTLTSFGLGLDVRTNILKIIFSVIILLFYYFRKYIPIGIWKFSYWLLFILPLVLVLLALISNYNVFKVLSSDQNYQYQNSLGEQTSLTNDTRTMLYVEVFNSLKNNKTLLFGEGAVGKYKSLLFDPLGDNRGRYGSEVGFLNTLLYSGIVGVIFYAIFLISTSYFAMYRSNNWLSKMLALLIAFHWFVYFIEEFTNFDLNFFSLWLILGLVGSQTFRYLTNVEIKQYLRI